MQRFDYVSRILIICSLIYLVPMCVVWVMDTKPPITMSRYTVTPAPPGGTLWAAADVLRDLDRNCTAVYTRRFVDAAGWPQSVEADTTRSSGTIAGMDRSAPGKLFFAVPLRRETAPGTGTIFTDLRYTCNPWHLLYPIDVSLQMRAEVLAP